METIQNTNTPNWLINAIQSQVSLRRDNEVITAGTLFSEGRRNNDMAALAGYLRSRGANEQEIFEKLLAMNETLQDPLPIDEIRSIARSIAKYDVRPDIFTHDNFARLISAKNKNKILYCAGRGFYIFDGKRWLNDLEGLKTVELVRLLIDEIFADILAMKGNLPDENWQNLRKASLKLKSADFIKKVFNF